MNTKPIPAIVMLLAGFITCIFGIKNHLEIMNFIWTLLIVMIVFFIIGSVVRFVADRWMKKMADKEEVPEEEPIESEGAEEEEKEEKPKKDDVEK